MTKGEDYIVISELPEEQQEALKKWLIGQTMPVVEQEGENAHNCCYRRDYDHFLAYWQAGQIAPVND